MDKTGSTLEQMGKKYNILVKNLKVKDLLKDYEQMAV
jgi:hypothetical protein